MNKESNTLFNAVENIIKKNMRSISYDKIGFIKSIISVDTCEVMVDKQASKIKNGIGVEFTPGNKCLVHYINGSEKNKVIIAKL